MNREKIINAIKMLSCSQGFYGRLLEFIREGSEESESFIADLESQNFSDVVDMVLYIEG